MGRWEQGRHFWRATQTRWSFAPHLHTTISWSLPPTHYKKDRALSAWAVSTSSPLVTSPTLSFENCNSLIRQGFLTSSGTDQAPPLHRVLVKQVQMAPYDYILYKKVTLLHVLLIKDNQINRTFGFCFPTSGFCLMSLGFHVSNLRS